MQTKMSDFDKNQVIHLESLDPEKGTYAAPPDSPSLKHGHLDLPVDPALADPAADRALLRKIDWCLIPYLSFLYLLSFLDRANIGNAKIDGLDKDLHMIDQQYLCTLTAFFFPYALFEVPSNILLKRLRPSIWISGIMLCWGTCMTLMGLVQNFSGLRAARFFLGVAEAGLFPGVTYYLSCYSSSPSLTFCDNYKFNLNLSFSSCTFSLVLLNRLWPRAPCYCPNVPNQEGSSNSASRSKSICKHHGIESCQPCRASSSLSVIAPSARQCPPREDFLQQYGMSKPGQSCVAEPLPLISTKATGPDRDQEFESDIEKGKPRQAQQHSRRYAHVGTGRRRMGSLDDNPACRFTRKADLSGCRANLLQTQPKAYDKVVGPGRMIFGQEADIEKNVLSRGYAQRCGKVYANSSWMGRGRPTNVSLMSAINCWVNQQLQPLIPVFHHCTPIGSHGEGLQVRLLGVGAVEMLQERSLLRAHDVLARGEDVLHGWTERVDQGISSGVNIHHLPIPQSEISSMSAKVFLPTTEVQPGRNIRRIVDVAQKNLGPFLVVAHGARCVFDDGHDI
ncbi:hypothetical protein G7K_3121-t1 [Saitoella complicata NRRL Y-17804]|uniref:Major facilitator superfamily (MFS) profile domain-containing protein n=1 Tax=Saitoella complicata (strain BCRC 22490 / CBS 7301 / JCM 7358 / NBRC 10748 / NRRL Y-17804) TaxID=698492 RepID=A0A0E9NHS9_SAICN|nr:hypothetical protein G7K_3121-t1 [Saitoella complicata NRRL Y-17804]